MKDFDWGGHVRDFESTLRTLDECARIVRGDPNNWAALRTLRRNLKVANAIQRALDRDFEARQPIKPK